MPAVAVHYIELSEKTNDLILGTHGRGVMIIDDISPLRQISQDVLQQDVHFFDSKPTVISEESNFGGTSTELEFVGPNPNRDAKIIYYLKKRHTFGKMAIDILDENGTKLIELTPGKSKGINVVTWNYLIKQPKMAKGKTLSFGGFTSPRVPAGKYKVVMRKGKDTYDTELELINDPNSLLTDQDRVALHETTIKLYNMSEQLAYLVYKIDESIAKSEQVMSVNANGKKVAEPISKELNTLKEKLVITTGDNYVGSAEPQLREKLSNLYSKIASGFEPPSSSEIENMTLLEEQFKDALTNFEKVQGKMNKMNKFIEEAKIEPIVFKSYEAFIEE